MHDDAINGPCAIIKWRSTQIYLTDAEHAALQQAARADCSMTAVVRDLIERHLIAAAASPTDLTDLIGVVSSAEPTDVATERGQRLYEQIIGDVGGHERPLRVAEP